MDALGTLGSLPKKITDVTTSISKGADSLDKMVGKMDAAVSKAQPNNPVSKAMVGGLSKTTGALKTGTMANNGAVAATINGTTVTSYTIPKGYHSGSGTVSLDGTIEAALAAL